MDRKTWQKKHSEWTWVSSACGGMSGVTAGRQLGREWLAGLLVAVLVGIVVAVLVPYLAWFFAPTGRKAQR